MPRKRNEKQTKEEIVLEESSELEMEKLLTIPIHVDQESLNGILRLIRLEIYHALEPIARTITNVMMEAGTSAFTPGIVKHKEKDGEKNGQQ